MRGLILKPTMTDGMFTFLCCVLRFCQPTVMNVIITWSCCKCFVYIILQMY